MRDQARRSFAAAAAAAVSVLVLAACGSSTSSSAQAGASSAAQSLLASTFSGAHAVNSGVLGFQLTVMPSGSRTLTGPISIGLTGPFQSRGAGQLPESDLAITFDALGHHGALRIASTGTAGYVTLKGAAYQLPAATYEKLASSFAGAGSGTAGLARLGIAPLHWLTAPAIIGSDSVAGARTTHLRARVNVSALLNDLATFLGRAAASGATGAATLPTNLSAATRAKIAAAIRNPSVDIWTGAADHTLRKLAIGLDIPVSGTISRLLGGLSSAAVQLTLQYANLNQRQTVTAPPHARPYSQFTARLRGIFSAIRGFGAGGPASAGQGPTPGSATPGAASPAGAQKYSHCIQQSGGDVAKMQTCASLLNGA